MNRREVIKQSSLASIGLLVSGPIATAIMQGCSSPQEAINWKPVFFSEKEARTLGAMAEAILPKTNTPGALDMGVDIFIDKMINDCYDEEGKKLFRNGIQTVNEKAGGDFAEINNSKKAEVLKAIQSLDEESFFYKFKELALLGYFSVEEVMKNQLQYVAIPTRLEGCSEIEEVQKLIVGNHITRIGFEVSRKNYEKRRKSF